MIAQHASLIIIGSGPAGYTAAIYAARAGLEPIVFAGYEAGGQLMITTEVENFPGFPAGISGPDLMTLFRKQAERFDARMIDQDIVEARFGERPFVVVSEGATYTADAVIIATGARARLLGVKGEKELWGRGVSACATCDGPFFKGADVAVIGGGDTAAEEALFLTRFAAKVYVVHRRDQFRASKVLVQRMRAHPQIEWVLSSVLVEIKGADRVNAVTVESTAEKEKGRRRDIAVGGVFMAIGYQPNTDLFKGQIEVREDGYIKVKAGTPETSVPGVFAAGDVQDSVWRQAVTAAGSGCAAAIAAERYLETLEKRR